MKPLVFVGAAILLAAQGMVVFAEEVPPPPYILTQVRGMIVTVTWEPEAIRKALPKSVKPVQDFSGGIVIYEVGTASDIGSYSSAYYYVEVEGHDSRDGTKAHWMLTGIYGPKPSVSAALARHCFLPVAPGQSAHTWSGETLRSTAVQEGRDLFTATVRQKSESCGPAFAFEHYPAVDSRGRLWLLQIPETGTFCEAELVSLNTDVPATSPFSRFRVQSKTGAYTFRDWAFSFTQPQLLPR